MKILLLPKCHYMSRDLLLEQYGRFYEIPYYLSRLGYSVDQVCHDYRNDTSVVFENEPSLTITSWHLGLEPLSGFWFHVRLVAEPPRNI